MTGQSSQVIGSNVGDLMKKIESFIESSKAQGISEAAAFEIVQAMYLGALITFNEIMTGNDSNLVREELQAVASKVAKMREVLVAQAELARRGNAQVH